MADVKFHVHPIIIFDLDAKNESLYAGLLRAIKNFYVYSLIVLQSEENLDFIMSSLNATTRSCIFNMSLEN